MLLGHFQKKKSVKYFLISYIILALPSKDDIFFTPSPDKYKIKDISVKTPIWSINKPYHKPKEKFQGIFDYKFKTYFGNEGPKYTFRPMYDQDGITEGKRAPGAPPKLIIPGPGYYDIKDSKTLPVFTIGQRIKIKKLANRGKIPGVGAYDLSKQNDWKVPCFSFGKEPRKNLLLNEESLKYNKGQNKIRLDLDEINSTKSPKWSLYHLDRFSKKPKSAQIEKMKYPGPGAYPIVTFIGEGPKYTFPKEKNNHTDPEDAYLSEKNKDFPGPTTYHKSMHYSPSGPFISISKLNRKGIDNDKYMLSIPDLNKYNPDKTHTSGWTIFPKWTILKTDLRNEKTKSNPDLGPGKYGFKSDIGLGPKFTFGKKLKKLKKFKNPGPGSYNINTDIFNGPKYTMGLKFKEIEENKNSKNKNKKPLMINIPSDIVNNKGFTFPKAESSKKVTRNKKKIIYPGPGDYKIPTSFDYISNLTRERGFFDPRYRYV